MYSICLVLRLAIKSFSAQKPRFLQASPQKIRAVWAKYFYCGRGEFLCATLICAITNIAHKERGNRPYNGRCPLPVTANTRRTIQLRLNYTCYVECFAWRLYSMPRRDSKRKPRFSRVIPRKIQAIIGAVFLYRKEWILRAKIISLIFQSNR